MFPFQWPTAAQFAISAFLLITAVLEMFDTAFEELLGFEMGTAHGLVVYALSKILKEGIEIRERYMEAREKLAGAQGGEKAA
ncbi:hypothetical protein [Azospirillum sp. SYSU D00513]|uniref:hypothetical protein n=1 Tax=Azospirillum sp. SYSU D00513 TaxID=2812561 RepID=UPI001A9587AA|nr:hypothetical protein [Azospirillum sp. SYSU D00513]